MPPNKRNRKLEHSKQLVVELELYLEPILGLDAFTRNADVIKVNY